MTSMLKLITFDVTGTMLKLRGSVGKQYAKIGSKYGVNIDPDALTNNFKGVFKHMLSEHPNYGVNDIGWKHWWEQLVHLMFTKSLPAGASIENDVLYKISADLIEKYSTKECWELTDGTLDLLETLGSRGITLGVLSNYDPRLERILKDLNIHKYFNFVVTSYSVKYEKPNPEIFKFVEDINEGVRKNEILHVGDNLKLDFYGAKNVGWNAILVGEGSDHYSQTDKDWIVRSLGDIYEKLVNHKLL